MQIFCLITTLDVLGRDNNREHHIIAYMKARFDRVIVVFRKRADPDSGLLDQLTGQSRITQDDNVTYVAVDPPLNPPEGRIRNATTHAARPSVLKQRLGQAIDMAAIARDKVTISALTRAAETALAGSDHVTTQALGPWAAAAAVKLRKKGVIPHFVYVDRDFEPGFVTSKTRQAWAARMERRAAQRADLTLSSSRRLRDRHRYLPKGAAQLSPTGVDLAAFPVVPDRTPAPHLAYVGEVTEWACLLEAIEAVAALNAKGVAARLSIRGPALPAFESTLRSWVQQLGAGAWVDWPGAVPRADALQTLKDAAIGYCGFHPTPLRVHALPLKLGEYFAMGLPSLATRGTEAGDHVERAGAGLAISPTGDAIAAAIKRIVDDPAAYRAMAQAARTAAVDLDWQSVLGREYALMQALADPGGAK